ncbi:PREDICTED: chloride transport protein 6-like [Acropora digitifera]|uniref:chloride transport protein 6-like n=1 Tax=Acropora digitifera TaxID=70779 RepID=UPI00077A5A1D|nr:PREDICTED: chloride transport protein 6-like [Acropora digitifera]
MTPVAAGSGIPEIKCYLNGVKVPHVVRLKTLVCKAVGVLFSVAGGLFVGKEGPMIHSGAIIGAGVPQFQSITCRKIKLNFPYFRTDREKRDFVSGGAAAGVAAAFGAPIGGVLFSLEEGSSFWNQSLTWRSFFCSMASTFTLNFCLSGINGNNEWGSFNQPGLLNFGVFKCSKATEKCNLWNIQDVLIFIAMGFVGGLLGAWFNQLNKHLTVHRILHVNARPKYVRILEVLLVGCVTTSVAFFSPIYLAYCKTLPQGGTNSSDTKDYFCRKGQYNDMATLFFASQESAIRQLFHLDGEFSLTSLAIFFICFYFLACWTYGTSVPSGLFVPCLLCGAAYGRFIGELCRCCDFFSCRLKAHDIMESCISYIYPHTRVQSVIGILRTTAHNAFPVVTVDKPAQQKIQESNFQASFGSFNERFAHSTTFSSLTSEQKLLRHVSNGEDNISLLRSRTESGFPLQSEAFDIKRKRFKSENSKDQLMYSTSSPGLSSSIDSNPSRIQYDLDDDEDDKDAFTASRAVIIYWVQKGNCEENEPQGLMFHGIILRSQLVTLLKKQIFYSESSERHICPELDFTSMTEDYPRFPDIHDLHFEFEDQKKIMDVTPYMNPCPYMVFPWTPVPLVFNLFRTMGLRHLIVINTKGQLVGMITRYNLTHEYMEHCLESLNED